MANLNYRFDAKTDEHCLERAKTYKYLGIDLDENLSWNSHIDNIIKKVSAGLEAIRRVRNLAPYQTLIMVYKALIHPYFDYCSSVWGSIGVRQSERLQKLQNRAARLITFSDLNITSSNLLSDLCWDSLERRRSKQLTIILFKILHNRAPTGKDKTWGRPWPRPWGRPWCRPWGRPWCRPWCRPWGRPWPTGG